MNKLASEWAGTRRGRARVSLLSLTLGSALLLGAAPEALRASGEESAAAEVAMAKEIASTGGVVLPRLYETLVHRSVTGENGEPSPLSLAEERVILRAVALIGREEVLALLGTMGEPRTLDRRRATIQFLGAAGRATELLRLLGMVRPGPDAAPQEDLVRAARGALVSLLERDPVGFGVLEETVSALPVEVLPIVIEAVGEVGDPAGYAFLNACGEKHPHLRGRILAQIPAIGRAEDPELEVPVRGWARTCLERDRSEERIPAIRVVATLEDAEAIPALLQLVASDSDDLRVASGAALEAMTGLAFETPDGWNRWYEAERAWILTRREGAFQKLSSADPGQVSEALEEIAPHPLVRAEFLDVLGDLLRTRSLEIRLLICRTLESTRAPESIPYLVALLDTGSEVEGRAACAALRAITGRDLPPDAGVWSGLASELGFPVQDG